MMWTFSTLKTRILLVEGGLATARSGLIGRTYTCLIGMTSLIAGQIQGVPKIQNEADKWPKIEKLDHI
jgi:hypothetical protein